MKSRGRKTAKVKGHEAPTVERRRGYSGANLQEQLDQRTRERDEARKLHAEALEQQTATSEVLKVISSSPGELEMVFQSMLENSVRICEAKFGQMFLCEGDNVRMVAHLGVPAALVKLDEQRGAFRPLPTGGLGRAIQTKEVIHIGDFASLQASNPVASLGGARSFISVPMLKENELIGVIAIYRQEVRPFTDKQIELVKNFAAQAVIAIENTRLLNELRESLQQQTATADVLKVISSSPAELEPVFKAMLENAVRICDAKFGHLWLREGDALRVGATHGTPAAFATYLREEPVLHPNPETGLGQLLANKRLFQLADIAAVPTYGDKLREATIKLAGARSLVGVPIVKGDEVIGAIVIYRQEVLPFTDKQIELITNFAAQAVIAIENTRLLNELRESLQQQTATADVLKVISRSAFDLQVVLDALVQSAAKLCEADSATIHRPEGDGYVCTATYGYAPEYRQYMRVHPIAPSRGSVLGRAVIDGKTVHVTDVEADPDYRLAEQRQIGAYRTVLGVPLLREGTAIGVIILTRNNVHPFSDKQIELVTTFADQAVIAIENVRLFDEVQRRTEDLTESLQQQTATADVLKVISRSTFDLQSVLTTLLQSAARLCEADRAALTRQIGDVFQHVASYGYSAEYQEHMATHTIPSGRGSVSGRAVLERKVIHVPDVRADTDYKVQDRAFDVRTALGVPLLREGTSIGVIILQRSSVRPFTDKQIELVTTFADQAVIAIENVRLFESVEARTRELANSLDNLRTAQDRLVQTEKLASLGQLTAGIAHEIKNPLNFVNNFSAVSVELIDELREALAGAHLESKLREEISEIADMLQGNLDKVVQHGKRADSIVKNMLLHSRQGSGEHRPVDINALVEESLNLAYHGARAEKQGFNITMEKSFDPAAGEVDLFPQEITRVLLNLISNGFYATTKRKAEADGSNYEPALAAVTKNLGDRVEIRIRDNGTGISPDVKEKMFNPFFTTKPAGEGTGLGLSISHDIVVKQHGGSIEVDTKPGEFTEFKIVLPRAGASLIK